MIAAAKNKIRIDNSPRSRAEVLNSACYCQLNADRRHCSGGGGDFLFAFGRTWSPGAAARAARLLFGRGVVLVSTDRRRERVEWNGLAIDLRLVGFFAGAALLALV